jgi:hypothetical protein
MKQNEYPKIELIIVGCLPSYAIQTNLKLTMMTCTRSSRYSVPETIIEIEDNQWDFKMKA